ncbi:hypothetical protein N7537_007848 [Penicillium hordei]|uniref:Uncharacterized protein n=1 Tax=Penicillium hordei TaxID=40994 RepID=A0AAD6DZU0_9EURO|nr:uncharacterized protein N7537_007848 [Penicillium hordei]KAJ5597764.1 hypothetical protein N7537_007848 [Penicillium hordei]
MNTTPQQIFNFEEAPLSEANPARLNGPSITNAVRGYTTTWLYGDTQAIRERRLHPSVNSFLASIYSPEPGLFYWVNDISMEFCSHCAGVVYDQQLHRAAFPMTLGSVQPIAEDEDMWFPLQRMLSNWIHMLLTGKITANFPECKVPEELARFRS